MKTPLPKRLIIVEHDVEQFSHAGHTSLKEVLTGGDQHAPGGIPVGVYRLVRVDYYSAQWTVRKLSKAKRAKELREAAAAKSGGEGEA